MIGEIKARTTPKFRQLNNVKSMNNKTMNKICNNFPQRESIHSKRKSKIKVWKSEPILRSKVKMSRKRVKKLKSIMSKVQTNVGV